MLGWNLTDVEQFRIAFLVDEEVEEYKSQIESILLLQYSEVQNGVEMLDQRLDSVGLRCEFCRDGGTWCFRSITASIPLDVTDSALSSGPETK